MARLGQPARFLGRFSADPFGQILAGKLVQDGVELAVPGWVAEPTALAIVSLGGLGVPEYWFHVSQTATFMLDQPTAQRALQDDVTAVHLGSVGLVVDPMASELERLVQRLPPDVLLLLDPNWRAQAIPDADAHRARLRRLLLRTDILKTSTEDLSFLVPGRGIADAARVLLDWGARSVLVTDGPSSIHAFIGGDQIAVQVPPVEVVDTAGAGDAFGGAFLAWWTERGLARENLAHPTQLLAAVTAAARVASLTCGRAGAEPPWRHELDTDEEWGQPLKP